MNETVRLEGDRQLKLQHRLRALEIAQTKAYNPSGSGIYNAKTTGYANVEDLLKDARVIEAYLNEEV